MKRGDVVTVALQGELGKPRPALVVQADAFVGTSSVTILPITSTLVEAALLRIDVEPDDRNGLLRRSQIMIDKPQTPAKSRIGAVIGRLQEDTMRSVDRALAIYLGLV